MKRSFCRRAVAVVAMSSVLSACSDTATPLDESNSIVDVATDLSKLSTFVTSLHTAELEATLKSTGPFTVFAPINMAFEALPTGTVNALLTSNNRESLQALLRYHVVPGRYTNDQLTDGLQLITLTGASLTVRVAANGLITVGGAAVIDADVDASNGVIHTVGRVLTQGLDIVQLAAVMPDLSTWSNATKTAGLSTTLSAEGSMLTVFAPNNASFAAVGAAVPTEAAELAQLLQLHLVNARISTNMMPDTQTLTSLLGPSLTVSVNGSAIQLTGPTNTVNITVTDLMARNGIIHVIDAVLLPQ